MHKTWRLMTLGHDGGTQGQGSRKFVERVYYRTKVSTTLEGKGKSLPGMCSRSVWAQAKDTAVDLTCMEPVLTGVYVFSTRSLALRYRAYGKPNVTDRGRAKPGPRSK